MFKWNVELTGPAASPYAVCPLPSAAATARPDDGANDVLHILGRNLQAAADAAGQLPVQASDPVVPDQDLPPECLQRRQGQHVPGHPAQRRLEAQLQDQCRAGDGARPAARAQSVSLSRSRLGLQLTPVRREDAVENSIADECKNHKASFEKTAKEWTKMYAN